MVIYTPKKFPDLPLSENYENFPAIAFEAQKYPDALTYKDFPSTLLKPGEKYRNRTTFNFEVIS